MSQWEHLLHTTSEKAKAELEALTPAKIATGRADKKTKVLIEASKQAALDLLEAGVVADGPIEIYLDGKPGIWAMVKVAKRGDEPED